MLLTSRSIKFGVVDQGFFQLFQRLLNNKNTSLPKDQKNIGLLAKGFFDFSILRI
jgi:hypothetical protein